MNYCCSDHRHGSFPWKENLVSSSIGGLARHYWSCHGLFWRHVLHCHWFLLHCPVHLARGSESCGKWGNAHGPPQAAPGRFVGSHVSSVIWGTFHLRSPMDSFPVAHTCHRHHSHHESTGLLLPLHNALSWHF